MKQVLDCKKMTDVELTIKVVELKSNLFNLRFKNKAGQQTKTSELSACKRDIARVLTEIKARNIDTTGLKIVKVKKETKKEAKKTDKVAEVKKAAEKVAAAKPVAEKAATKPAAKTATKTTTESKSAVAKTTTKKEAK